jgi:hypothetical protein
MDEQEAGGKMKYRIVSATRRYPEFVGTPSHGGFYDTDPVYRTAPNTGRVLSLKNNGWKIIKLKDVPSALKREIEALDVNDIIVMGKEIR